MNSEKSLSGEHKFTIQAVDAVSYIVGRTMNNEQVIAGLPGPFLVAVFFDLNGTYSRAEGRSADGRQVSLVQAPHKPDPRSASQLWDQLGAWTTEMGLAPSTIVVSKFFLSNLRVGILEFPDHLQDIVKDPNSEPNAELRKELIEEAVEWSRDGKFVLRWGNDYWMDRSGDVTDT